MEDTRMLEEPDLFISLNNAGGHGCNTLGSVASSVTSSSVGPVSTLKRQQDTCVRHVHGCLDTRHAAGEGSTLQLHDIHCVPAYSAAFAPDPRSVKSRVLGLNVGDIKARKWYLVVILLLYIGLITSFCLNISLLLRTYPKQNESSQTTTTLKSKGILQAADGAGERGPGQSEATQQSAKREYVYSTACLVEDPCEAGHYYSCSHRSCLPCDLGTFQPVWGQTSCWSCPPNTTTDTEGAASPADCKATACVHHSRPGLAVLQSPNYPAPLPASSNCHWRVEPGPGVSVLLIIPSLSLPPDCSYSLRVRRGRPARTVFSSCRTSDGPLLVTSQGSGEMWVDFRSTNKSSLGSSSSSTGFQVSLVSVSDDMRQVIDTVTSSGSGYSGLQDSLARHGGAGGGQADQQLVRHILKLLSAKVGNGKVVKAAAGVELPKITGAAPQYGQELITVVEETEAGPSGHTDTWDTQQFS